MQLPTWAHRSMFSYTGSVLTGTVIEYGEGAASTDATAFLIRVSADQYRALLTTFKGAQVPVGSSRNPLPDTLEYWLQQNVTPTASASYVAPILIHEKYAARVAGSETEIQFL